MGFFDKSKGNLFPGMDFSDAQDSLRFEDPSNLKIGDFFWFSPFCFRFTSVGLWVWFSLVCLIVFSLLFWRGNSVSAGFMLLFLLVCVMKLVKTVRQLKGWRLMSTNYYDLFLREYTVGESV